MHKLVVLYAEPDNPKAFIEYYTTTHLPLAAKLPGLLGWRYSIEITETQDSKAPYFAVFEAEFENAEAFRVAMSSPQGQAVTEDVPNYATGGATVIDYTISGGEES
ncbi:MAG TPA: EthD family reductase [Candidatus Yaniella excrementavium]|nr:EthD family reductase [Candidatus Yaniella excrementavium]